MEGVEADPAPRAFVALTVKVYLTPLVRDVTTQFVVPTAVQVRPLGLDVTVYCVISVPPLLAGGVQVTRAEAGPYFATALVGGFGRTFGTTEPEKEDQGLRPSELMALTWNL